MEVILRRTRMTRSPSDAPIPLHAVDRKCTSSARTGDIRDQEEEMFFDEAETWATLRDAQRSRSGLCEQVTNSLRPGQSFMMEILFGSLLLTAAGSLDGRDLRVSSLSADGDQPPR